MISLETGFMISLGLIALLYGLGAAARRNENSAEITAVGIATVFMIGYVLYMIAIEVSAMSGHSLWTEQTADPGAAYPVIGIEDGRAYYSDGTFENRADSLSVRDAETDASGDAVRMVRFVDRTGLFYTEIPRLYLTSETTAGLSPDE